MVVSVGLLPWHKYSLIDDWSSNTLNWSANGFNYLPRVWWFSDLMEPGLPEFLSISYILLNLLPFMSPTKILLIVVIFAFLGLAALAFQLTKGVSNSESSTELQEAMPALQ